MPASCDAIRRSSASIIFGLLFLLTVLPVRSLKAQSSFAFLTGTISDSSGALVAQASVSLRDPNRGSMRTVHSNKSGFFVFPDLAPGSYLLQVDKQGFGVMLLTVSLRTDDRRDLQIKLKVGDASETVNVSAANTSPAISTTIDRALVDNLPLNGLSFQSLILISPGVTVTPSTAYSNGQFSVNGQRSTSNTLSLDGVSANVGVSPNVTLSYTPVAAANADLAGQNIGTNVLGSTAGLTSVEGLQEFTIQSSSATAQYGRQTGGQISLTTRSGSNRFHGNVFEFFRNDAMDARGYFNRTSARKAALRQNDFGGSVGGPVLIPHLYDGRNKTFFFATYEGLRLRQPASGTINVPSTFSRSVASTNVRLAMNAFPLPNTTETLVTCKTNSAVDCICPTSTTVCYNGYESSVYNYAISNPGIMDSGNMRLDHKLTNKVQLFARYTESPSSKSGFGGVSYGSLQSVNTQSLTAGSTAILNMHLFDDLRVNWTRNGARGQYISSTVGGAVPLPLSYLTAGLPHRLGQVYFTTNDGVSMLTMAGQPQDTIQRQWNIVNNFGWTHRTHTMLFGVDYRRLSPSYANNDQESQSFYGSIYGYGTGFQNDTSDFTEVLSYSSTTLRYDNYSFFGQDTWQTTKRLTLNYGLRWDINPPPVATSGPSAVFVLNATPNSVANATLAPAGTTLYGTSLGGFAPRFGFAYQAHQSPNKESVIRMGIGLYYDPGNAAGSAGYPRVAVSFPPKVNGVQLYSSPFPAPAAYVASADIPSATTPVLTTSYAVNNDLKLPYSMQFNGTVDQGLGKGQSLTLSYVGQIGRRQITTQALNMSSANGASTANRNTNFSTIYYSYNGPSSDYHSFQAQYRVRMGTQLQALVNYSWAHSLDSVSQDLVNGSLVRGNSDFDIRHNFSAAAVWSIPRYGKNDLVSSVTRGWMVSGLVHDQTGRPLDIMSSTQILSNGQDLALRPNLVDGRTVESVYKYSATIPGHRYFDSTAFSTPSKVNGLYSQGNFGRNILRALALNQADVAFGRTFQFTEHANLRFRAEAFNITNRPNFGSYGLTYTSASTFGVPTATLNNALGGLNSIYQLGGSRSLQMSLRLGF